MPNSKITELTVATTASATDLIPIVTGIGSTPVNKAISAQNLFGTMGGASGYSGIQGISGYSGHLGVDGISGYSGISGISGASGFSGITGNDGQGFNFSGDWMLGTGYSAYDVVHNIGNAYLCYSQILDTTVDDEPGVGGNWTNYWQLFVDRGVSGYSGISGISGYSGVSGYSGRSGYSGYSGYSGISGYVGTSGYSGISGASGLSGYVGTSGYSGISGSNGTSGYSGVSGVTGLSGYSGAVGSGTSGYSGYGGMTSGTYPLTDGATIAINWANGATQTVTLGATGRTVTFSGAVAGQVYRFIIKQDSGGSKTITTWPTIKWAGGSAPTLTTTGSKADIVTILYDGTDYYADCTKNF